MYHSPQYFVLEFPAPAVLLRPNPSLEYLLQAPYGLGEPLP